MWSYFLSVKLMPWMGYTEKCFTIYRQWDYWTGLFDRSTVHIGLFTKEVNPRLAKRPLKWAFSLLRVNFLNQWGQVNLKVQLLIHVLLIVSEMGLGYIIIGILSV